MRTWLIHRAQPHTLLFVQQPAWNGSHLMNSPHLRLASRLASAVQRRFDRFVEVSLANMEHSGLWWKHHSESHASPPDL